MLLSLQPKTLHRVPCAKEEGRQDNRIVKIYRYKEALAPLSSLFLEYSSDSHQIIAYTNQCVDAINEIVNGGKEFKVGSKVILQSNDYEQEQYNGFQFRIQSIHKEKKTISYICKSIETGTMHKFTTSQIALGYAITTMKAQGSAWPHVLGVLNTYPAEYRLDTYVIATRQEKSVRFIEIEHEKTVSFEDKLERLAKQAPKELEDAILQLARAVSPSAE